ARRPGVGVARIVARHLPRPVGVSGNYSGGVAGARRRQAEGAAAAAVARVADRPERARPRVLAPGVRSGVVLLRVLDARIPEAGTRIQPERHRYVRLDSVRGGGPWRHGLGGRGPPGHSPGGPPRGGPHPT